MSRPHRINWAGETGWFVPDPDSPYDPEPEPEWGEGPERVAMAAEKSRPPTLAEAAMTMLVEQLVETVTEAIRDQFPR